MRGNQFGKLFSISTFGESHGEALGVTIDGMPSKLKVNLETLQSWMDKRRPGRLEVSSSRKEEDRIEVLSGIKDEITLGTPITIIVRNTNHKSADYDKLKNQYRPGHADKTTEYKYGIRDYRGGGRASGRETLARVIGGYFASLVVPQVQIKSVITQLAHFQEERVNFELLLGDIGYVEPDKEKEIKSFLLKLKEDGDSCGGKISVQIKNIPKALGEPVFDKLKADLAKATLSIGSCTGFNYGSEYDLSYKTGKQLSIPPYLFTGIEGGISNGEEIIFHNSFKAPSTVGENAKEGRHDPCILPRVRVVIESMVYLVIADHYLRQRAYNSDISFE